MKPLTSLLLLLSVTTTLHAQMDVISKNIDKATPVDTARYEVTYSLDYTCHPKADQRFSDVRTLLVGRHSIKDHSDIIHHYDSICTIDKKRGANSFSNPKGNPFPYEILLTDRAKKADIKYRLPIGCGTLHYREDVPAFKWEYFADSSKTIIGYECRLATTEFAGRIYSAWYATELPMPYGPYKFNGLPGLILHIQDAESQFIWEATAIAKSDKPICNYDYDDEKNCTSDEAAKTINRCFKSPIAFLLAALGGGKGRINIVGSDGKTRDATEIEDSPIPYLPLEIK